MVVNLWSQFWGKQSLINCICIFCCCQGTLKHCNTESKLFISMASFIDLKKNSHCSFCQKSQRLFLLSLLKTVYLSGSKGPISHLFTDLPDKYKPKLEPSPLLPSSLQGGFTGLTNAGRVQGRHSVSSVVCTGQLWLMDQVATALWTAKETEQRDSYMSRNRSEHNRVKRELETGKHGWWWGEGGREDEKVLTKRGTGWQIEKQEHISVQPIKLWKINFPLLFSCAFVPWLNLFILSRFFALFCLPLLIDVREGWHHFLRPM